MDTVLILAIIVIAALVLGGIAWFYSQRQQSQKLQDRFGPEYERATTEAGSKRDAERELQQRASRVEKLHIKDLGREEQMRYSDDWKTVQAHFVDDPAKAIGEADDLVQKVMEARGYPITDFDQQAADISVDHPDVVTHYRAAHAIAETHESEPVGTEDLRQALLHYRALFAELLGTSPVSASPERR